MFKFIGNIFNFKLTWRLRLKFYYFFAKVHALAHFTYEEEKKKVFFSSVSVVYGSAWTIFYFLELIALLYSFSVSGMMFNGSVVLNFVHALELTTIVLKALFIYILQIIQSKDLVLLINDAISINQVINFTYRKEDNLYSQQFERLYNLKKRCLMLQSVLLFASYYIYLEQQDENNPTEITLGFLVVYTHFSTVVVSGIYFYGSLLFGYDFYYFLNRKLNLILKQFEFDRKSKFRTRTQSYCQACDDLDKISVVYTRINLYIVKINRMSVVQIAGELLGSFVMITSALFYMFYGLLSSVVAPDSKEWEDPLFEVLNSVIYSLVFCTEIYTIISISIAVMDEADKLSTYLYPSLFINADKRFVRCVQQLSLKAFFEKPIISPMGMFTIDRTLIIGIGATIATYLIILIQFQLDRKQRSVGSS